MILNFKIDKRDRIIFLWCSSLRIERGSTTVVPPRLNLGVKRGSGEENPWLNRRKNSEQQHIKEIDNEKIKLRPPDSVNIFKYSISDKPIQPKKESTCLNCGQKVENYRLYEISFKTIIEGHDNRKRDRQYYGIFNKINMTSSGIEVMTNSEKKNNEIYNKLKVNKLNNFIIPKIIQELYPKLKFQDYFNLKNDTIFRSKTTCVCDDCYLDITKYCSMAGSNNENLIRTFKKDENFSGFYDMIKKVRPKSVMGTNKNNLLTDINIQNKNSINKKIKKNFELSLNDSNSNLISFLKEKDKKKVKKSLMTNYNINSIKRANLSNKNFRILTKTNINNNKKGFNIIEFPKLKNQNEISSSKETGTRMYTEINMDIHSKFDVNPKYLSKNKSSGKKEFEKLNLKNYLTKKDFTYFD
jgi:hypothetical protein